MNTTKFGWCSVLVCKDWSMTSREVSPSLQYGALIIDIKSLLMQGMYNV